MSFRSYLAGAAAALLISASPARAFNDGVPLTPTVQTAAYSSGNAIGGLLTVPFFRNSNLKAAGVLDAAMLTSVSGATVPVTFYVFDTQPTATPCTDRSAFSLGAADIPNLAVQPFTLTPAATTGTTSSSAQLIQSSSVANHDLAPTRQLYVCLVVGGSYTPPTASDLTIKLSGALD